MTIRKPPVDIDTSWYEAALAREESRMKTGRAALGDEQIVFAWGIARIAEVLDVVCSEELIYDKPTKALFSIAHSTYTLLWSAWLDALCGRQASALNHWRSIHESSDFMRAIHIVPDLGHAFLDGKLSVEAVRRQLLKARSADGSRAKAVARDSASRRLNKMFEPLSHVSLESMNATLPLEIPPGDGPVFYVREGFDGETARITCQFLAAEAMLLFAICIQVFGDRKGVIAFYDDSVRSIESRVADLLDVTDQAENQS